MSCQRCRRRSALLERLGATLDLRAREPTRLWEALALRDEQLIAALGGGRRAQLRAWHASFEGTPPPPGRQDVERICRHARAYPRSLRESRFAPCELHLMGGERRLRELLREPVVAIVGTRRCTDHGMQLARGLARALAGAGVTVLVELAAGVGYGAALGVLDAGGRGAALLGGGIERGSPACCAAVYRALQESGCVLSELPGASHPRRWSELARGRTLALLADLLVVVEARLQAHELACAHLARALGRRLAAVPGRVSSPTAQGAHRLIREGAVLLSGARDALELLHGVEPGVLASGAEPDAPDRLDPSLQRTLERVTAGEDTPARLCARRGEAQETHEVQQVLVELAELELRGLLTRGDGGRYVPCAVTPGE
jgi:DNA processing protein